jgi:excisionase family DNA binding protein
MQATATTVPRLAYGIAEAADLIGVSTATIRRLIDANKLPCARVGDRVLIPRQELERLLATTK